jgi:hypothetical protein
VTAWQSVKPGDTVTISRTFVVAQAHISEATGHGIVYDADFRGHSEAEGFALEIVRDDPWHSMLDGKGAGAKCGCQIGHDHLINEYYDHFELDQHRKETA